MPQSNFQIFSDICQDVYRTVLGHHQIKGVKVDVPRGWKSEILTTFPSENQQLGSSPECIPPAQPRFAPHSSVPVTVYYSVGYSTAPARRRGRSLTERQAATCIASPPYKVRHAWMGNQINHMGVALACTAQSIHPTTCHAGRPRPLLSFATERDDPIYMRTRPRAGNQRRRSPGLSGHIISIYC
jgi:hypothetical protein